MQRFLIDNSRLADYQILAQLGKGSSGQVFKVKHKSTNQIYALKKVNLSGVHDKEKIQAFRQIKALKMLSHHSIIQYYDSFLSMDHLYIVTEFAQKGDLSKELSKRRKNQKKFTQQQLWSIFQTLVEGVKDLHQKHIIHRDIKAENIFISSQGKYKIGDLGLSKQIKNQETLSSRVGTPIYFAPQIIQHRMYSFPVDIWALGCIFYFLAALEHPFEDARLQNLGHLVIDKDPKPIKGSYSPQLINFIKFVLQKNADKRPTIHEVRKKLRERKEEKIGNRIAIFNLRQVLSLKSQHTKEVVKKQQKIAHIHRQDFVIPETDLKIEGEKQRINNWMIENPEKRSVTNRSSLQNRNYSMAVPSSTSKINRVNTTKPKERTSWMIKSNGFSLNIVLPDKIKPKSVFGSTQRYQRNITDV